jgi:hypothetical protein
MIINQDVFSESPEYYHRYLSLVEGEDILDTLIHSMFSTIGHLRALSAAEWDASYAPGKWTLREVWMHVADCERMLAMRALCIARRDTAILSEFDQDTFAKWSRADKRQTDDILKELQAIRDSNVWLFRALSEEDWLERGRVGHMVFTPRALAGILIGHERHHVKQMKEVYLPNRDWPAM